MEQKQNKSKKPKKVCQYCGKKPKLIRPKNNLPSCLPCFYHNFEEEIHHTIMTEKLFKENQKIILAISGGKDSTVLAHVMTTLKKRYNYPITLELLAIDEGIVGYRDDSLKTVVANSKFYKLPLTILSYQNLFGKTMDKVVSLTDVKNSCTYCGVFRRQALNIGLKQLKGDRLYTGHNADDMAETILMNMLRGDAFRLINCTEAITGSEGELQRCKPFKFTYEKEIVLYAYYQKLVYFSTECTYATEAFRGHLKELMKDLMDLKAGVITDIIMNAEGIQLQKKITLPTKGVCSVCGSVSSNKICKSCKFIDDLKKIERKKEKVVLKLEE